MKKRKIRLLFSTALITVATFCLWISLGHLGVLNCSTYRFEYVLWKRFNVCALSKSQISTIISLEDARSLGILNKSIAEIKPHFCPLTLSDTPVTADQRILQSELEPYFTEIKNMGHYNTFLGLGPSDDPTPVPGEKIKSMKVVWIGNWTNFLIVVEGKIQAKLFRKPV